MILNAPILMQSQILIKFISKTHYGRIEHTIYQLTRQMPQDHPIHMGWIFFSLTKNHLNSSTIDSHRKQKKNTLVISNQGICLIYWCSSKSNCQKSHNSVQSPNQIQIMGTCSQTQRIVFLQLFLLERPNQESRTGSIINDFKKGAIIHSLVAIHCLSFDKFYR